MLTIAICEDEPYFSAKLQELLRQYLDGKKLPASVSVFENGERLLHSGQKPDILLMDIRLPGKNGMDITAQFRKKDPSCPVIFITSYKEYVFRAFDLDAVHYLLKPVSRVKLFAAMDKAMKRLSRSQEKFILLPKGDVTAKIYFQDILFCEIFDHQLVVHTLTEDFRISGTLDALHEKLDDRFFRCHRSYLVNMDFVTGKKEGAAFITGGCRVLISRRKQREFTHRLLQSCQREE